MNAAVVDFKPSLRSAQHAFEQWRSSRTRRGPTPMALRQCAVALLEQHCAFHVCRALRINANALKEWSGQSVPLSTSAEYPVDADHPTGFVRLPDVKEALLDSTPQFTNSLIIELPNETVIHIRRAFTLEEVFQAAARVGSNVSAC
jgi:hypothetical protein